MEGDEVAEHGGELGCGDAIGALQDVHDLEDDELREEDFEPAVFGFQQERFRRGALLVVAMDERGEEDIGVDDDALHVRCALSASGLRGRLSPRR